ncbi:unnamed protein product [Umbelopsis ramanniana]
MSDRQFAQILTSEPDQLSSSPEEDLHETSVLEDPRGAMTNPSPRPTIDSMQSNDTYFTAVSKDEGTQQVPDENEDVVEPDDIDYETASTVSSRSTIKQSIHSHETLRTPSPPSRSTSLPISSGIKSTDTDGQTPAQAIAQLVRGRTVNSSPSSEHQNRRQKPPSMIEIPISSQTVPRIEEHLASPTSIPSEFMNRNAKSVDLGLLMEHPVMEGRKRSIRRGGQSSRSPPTSPNDNPRNSIASISAISTVNDIYIPISPHPCDAGDDEELVMKRDTILCTTSVTAYNKEPMMYKASVASRYHRMKGKWREYDLVLTNKRLELTTNKIGSQGNRILHCVPFRENNKESSISLSLLSPLDYTIKLEHTDSANRNVTTFVFKARTQSQCTEWYMALYRVLPESEKKPITPWTEIFVPDLNIQIRIPLQDEGVVSNEVNVTAQTVEKAAIHLLHNDQTWSELLANISGSQQFGLCWTIQDRIEWIPLAPKHGPVSQSNFIIGPQSIEQTHTLELRAVEHAPDYVTLRNGETITEPPAVSGFLQRENNYRGKKYSQKGLNSRRVYVCTQQHLLFFLPFYKIDAIDQVEQSPTSMKGSFSAKSLTSFQQSSASNLNRRFMEPMTFSSTAHITDQSAHHRALRRKVARNAAIIHNATHLINLLEVVDVRPMMSPGGAGSSSYTNIARFFSNQSAGGVPTSNYANEANCFELEMQNGVVARLQAATPDAMEDWVQSLYQLIQYWKARKQADLATHVAVKQANHRLVPLHDVYHEHGEQPYQETLALFMDEVEEVEESRTVANSQIWNICTVNGCQSIVKCGPLYVKHGIRRTFSQKYVILGANETLHYFQYLFRNRMTGQVLPTSTHEHQMAIDLRQTYIYSGRQCLEDKVVYDFERPNRIFADGLVSNDDVKECTFVLWQAKHSTGLFESKKSRLASKGTLFIFMARSRQEKEEWVWAIQQCIDRASRDIKEDPVTSEHNPNEIPRQPLHAQDTTSLYTI